MTYSPTIMAVPSALAVLTSLFGKGRGEPRCHNHHNILNISFEIFDVCKERCKEKEKIIMSFMIESYG